MEMFGTLRACSGSHVLTRFRTRRVALLLAFLSYHRSREFAREEIGDMLWPEHEDEAIRRNLRQAIHSLRQAIEPPPLPAGSILQVKQGRISLDPSRVATDTQEFEQLLAQARSASSADGQIALYESALALFRGELLPGFHDEWVLRERLRMEDLFVSCLRRLVALTKAEDRPDEAIAHLRRALTAEPLQEEWHTELIELYLQVHRPASALKQYRELEQLLRDQLGCEPSARSRSLGEAARRAASIPEPAARLPRRARGREAHPAARPVPAPQPRLPVQITRFFGRRDELEQIREKLVRDRARLVTVVGPAGIGKTRLSLEVARTVAEMDGWHVWFAPLEDLSDASMLLDEIADRLNARQPNVAELMESIAISVQGDSNLLILDNFEHILERGADVVARLLQRVPNLQMLVTSRQSLKLTGEREYPLDPLPAPLPRSSLAPVTRDELILLAENPSIQIFLDRSQAIRPDAQLTVSNAATIASICSKLEGMPLAIELAAGQTGTIAPSQMLKHLEHRLTALSTRRRDATPRHKSLRAAIDYSFESLPPNLQRFFVALSVFRGGFTVESALEVSMAWVEQGAASHEACLEQIVDLQERSLLRPDSSAETPDPRFRMLESFRQFGEEHLAPPDLQRLRERHADYFLSHFGGLPEHATSDDHAQLYHRIDAEHENFVAALDFLFQARDFERCVRMLGILSQRWLQSGPRVIEREYIRQISILTRGQLVDPATQIRLLRMLGTTHIRTSDYAAAHRAMQSAVEIALLAGDNDQIAVCYCGLSTCAGFLGRLRECFELNEKALAIVSPDNIALLERIHLGMGAVHWAEARLPEAESEYLLARGYSERVRGGEPDPLILYNLARTSLDLGRPDEAMRLVSEAIRTCKRLGDSYTLATCLAVVARYHWKAGDLAAALATSHEALTQSQQTVFQFLTLFCVRNHALILCAAEDWDAASVLLAASQSLSKMNRTLDDMDFAEARKSCSEHLGSKPFARAWARGLSMGADEAYSLASQYK